MPVVPTFPVYAADPATKSLVDRYIAAAEPEAARVVGKVAGPVTKETHDREHTAGLLIADAQLAASRAHGAQVAFMNTGGVRADLVPSPNGDVSYGQIFAMQPFGNSLVVKTLTGTQLKTLLEQQFQADRPKMLMPSRGFFFAYDERLPAGRRVVEMRLNGKAIDPGGRYRVAVNHFLASGGDMFTVLAEGTDAVDLGLDLDALEAWLKKGAPVPQLGRIKNLAPAPSP